MGYKFLQALGNRVENGNVLTRWLIGCDSAADISSLPTEEYSVTDVVGTKSGTLDYFSEVVLPDGSKYMLNTGRVWMRSPGNSHDASVALTRTQGAGTTLTVALTHMGRVALTTPITITTGDVLYKGDKFSVTVGGGTATVTGATQVSAGVYIVTGGVPVTVVSAA